MFTRSIRTLAAAALLLLGGGAYSQPCGRALPGDPLAGVTGTVSCMLSWDPDGAGPAPPQLVLGGEFSVAGNLIVSNLASWDGSHWSALGGGANGKVNALAVHDGLLLAAGDFTRIGGVAASRVARWDGTAWSAMGSDFPGEVTTVLSDEQGLVVGGRVFEPHSNGLASWDGQQWTPWTGSRCGTLARIVRYAGSIYAAGEFPTGYAVDRWTGAGWERVSPPQSFRAQDLLVSGGLLYATGRSWASGGDRLVVQTFDGTAWTEVFSGSYHYPDSLRFAEINGQVYLAIGYSSWGDGGISRWDGSTWQYVPGAPRSVPAITSHAGELVACSDGQLWGLRNVAIRHLSGGTWTSLVPGVEGQIKRLFSAHGSLIAAGYWSWLNGPMDAGLALRQGSTWIPFPGPSVDSYAGFATFQGDFFIANRTSGLWRWDGNTSVQVVPSNGRDIGWIVPTAGTLYVVWTDDHANYTMSRWDGHAGLQDLFTSQHIGPVCEFGNMLLGAEASDDWLGRRLVLWDGTSWRPGPPGEFDAEYGWSIGVFHGEIYVAGRFRGEGSAPGALWKWASDRWVSVFRFTQIFECPIANLIPLADQLLMIGGLAEPIDARGVLLFDGQGVSPLGKGANGAVYDALELNGRLVLGGDLSALDGQPSALIAEWSTPGTQLPFVRSFGPTSLRISQGHTIRLHVAPASPEVSVRWKWQDRLLEDGTWNDSLQISGSHTPDLAIRIISGYWLAMSGLYAELTNACGTVETTHAEVWIPRPDCPADIVPTWDQMPIYTDNAVTIDDLLYFLERYETRSEEADVDDGSGLGQPDDAVDASDLMYYLQHYAQGC